MRKQWTQKEIIFLRNNFKSKTALEIAKMLNRNKDSIDNKLHSMGLRKTKLYNLIESGSRFGKLTVLKHTSIKINGRTKYLCQCDCSPCCTICNIAKNSSSYSDFLNWIKKVYQLKFLGNNTFPRERTQTFNTNRS